MEKAGLNRKVRGRAMSIVLGMAGPGCLGQSELSVEWPGRDIAVKRVEDWFHTYSDQR